MAEPLLHFSEDPSIEVFEPHVAPERGRMVRSRARELRVVPSLWPLIDAIVASGLEFSIIRKAHALPRA